jgi:PAS domain S-box-containing protein
MNVHHSAVGHDGIDLHMAAATAKAGTQGGESGRGHAAQPDLHSLFDAMAEGLCSTDREGRITLCNTAFLRMTGFRCTEDVLGKMLNCLVRHDRGDGSPHANGHCPILDVIRAGTHAHADDAFVHRADGTRMSVEYWIRPIIREDRVEGAACTVMDITERKQAETQQMLLNRELTHRVKNTLTVVQAIVSQTLRSTAERKDAMQAINARLFALRDANELLMSTKHEDALLSDVIGRGFAVYGVDNPRIHVAGSDLGVGPRTAAALTMTLHELCTNAVKHGALSNNIGNVALVWTVDQDIGDPKLRVLWKERGGPPVEVPARMGFGSQIIRQYCKSLVDAEFALEFKSQGLEWALEVPVESLKQ